MNVGLSNCGEKNVQKTRLFKSNFSFNYYLPVLWIRIRKNSKFLAESGSEFVKKCFISP
jgi:hypothetical protein